MDSKIGLLVHRPRFAAALVWHEQFLVLGCRNMRVSIRAIP